MKLTDFQSLVFDCDGVILDANAVKTNAFYQAALPYGEEAARELRNYHVANGGISRYRKFHHFLEQIVPAGSSGPSMDELLAHYAEAVRQGLSECRVAPGLTQLRAATPNATWCVVSGGDQQELRAVFAERQLDHLFDGGIYGSPDTKEQITEREMHNGTIRTPAVFIGDSRYDFEVSRESGMDFIFLTDWSEVTDYSELFGTSPVMVENNIESLLAYA